MPNARVITFTLLALIAFAGNSLLCRAALANTHIDSASFTAVRLISGAFVLWLLVSSRKNEIRGSGSWLSALALFAYAAGFSFAYVGLTAAVGALLLFGSVQITMIGYGLWAGERMGRLQFIGLFFAGGGLVELLLPGLLAPPLIASLLMVGAGIAWGIYSLRGKALGGDPLKVTSGNFIRAAPFAIALNIILLSHSSIDGMGVLYAALSGALASGFGYAIWYAALPSLKSTTAATVQLAVPIIAALGGVVFLREEFTLRLLIATVTIVGGIALVVCAGRRADLPA